MANQKVKTVPLSKDRFREARKIRKMSLTSLSEKPGIERTEKTLRRWIRRGEIPPDLLDAIGKELNVDPKFISGELDRIAEGIEDDPVKLSTLKAQFHAADFPYVYKQKRELKPLQYIIDLLIDNDIPPEELEKLSRTELVKLYLELEKATRAIIFKYFTPHQSSLHNYSIPMPPDDEIIKL